MKLGIFLDSELVTSELWHFQSEAVEKMTRVDRTSHFISSFRRYRKHGTGFNLVRW